jgi:uncharacterized protein GlcG (DUF336 family)
LEDADRELFLNKASITAAAARLIVDASVKKAEHLGAQVSIAVCDESAVLLAFHRMDGSSLISVGIAMDKAFSAASFDRATDTWSDFLADKPGLRLGIPNQPRVVTFGGGYPIHAANGTLAGAIGVSGSTEEIDMEVAKAGLAALERHA